jgi:hypothetical protein
VLKSVKEFLLKTPAHDIQEAKGLYTVSMFVRSVVEHKFAGGKVVVAPEDVGANVVVTLALVVLVGAPVVVLNAGPQ